MKNLRHLATPPVSVVNEVEGGMHRVCSAMLALAFPLNLFTNTLKA